MPTCQICQANPAILHRSKTKQSLCTTCFYHAFETEIHNTIIDNKLFKRGEKIAIGCSGGKDSTVLAEVMTTLNKRYDYGLDLTLLSIDEGITGYRIDSLATVKRNQKQYQLPLQILSYEDLYGWTMDEIVKEVGLKNNCTFCGVFRRQALDRGAAMLGIHHVITGHNADDIAETVLMNLLRGDIARLARTTPILINEGKISRSKPFKYAYEKDIVLYAYYKKLDYFSTECTYAPGAYRGFARLFLKDAERIRPSTILDIIRSGEAFQVKEDSISSKTIGDCTRCGYMSSSKLCKACMLLEGLNRGKPMLGIRTDPRKEHVQVDHVARKVVERFADIQLNFESLIR